MIPNIPDPVSGDLQTQDLIGAEKGFTYPDEIPEVEYLRKALVAIGDASKVEPYTLHPWDGRDLRKDLGMFIESVFAKTWNTFEPVTGFRKTDNFVRSMDTDLSRILDEASEVFVDNISEEKP